MSEKTGTPLSTLAKVEADKLSLSYDKLQQFASRLGLSMTEFLARAEQGDGQAARNVVMARRSVSENGNSVRVSTPTYDYEYLCADLQKKRMIPVMVRIRKQSLDDFGDPVRHAGEEFVFVLEGAIEVYSEFYTTIVLAAGQGVYLDSTMAHAYVAKDCESALVLAVCSAEDPNLAGELMGLAESEAAAK